MADKFWVEVMQPGVWKDARGREVEFTTDDLNGIASAFKETFPEVRPTLRLGGHPDAENLQPAVGWVEDVRVRDDGILEMLFSDVPSIVVDAMKSRLYRKVSAGLRKAVNFKGKTLDWALDHVAILGASLPAISGLADLDKFMASASIPDAVVNFTKSDEGDDSMDKELYEEQKGLREAAEQKVTELSASIEDITAERDALQAKLDEANEARQTIEAEVAKFAAEKVRAEVESVVDKAVEAGNLLPKFRDQQVAIGLSLQESSVNFSSEDEDAKSPFDAWKDQLAESKMIEFSEKGEVGDDEDADETSEFDKQFAVGAAAAKAIKDLPR
jgi:hypothetical protein